MDLRTCNHSSYPRIGADAAHQTLRRTIAKFDKGLMTERDVRAAEDLMTEYALRDQIDAGLDVVTDGQIRWYDPVSHVTGALRGVKIDGLLRFFDTNFYFRQPVVEREVKWSHTVLLDAFRFAQGKSTRPVKIVLTGPYTLARSSVASCGIATLTETYTAAMTQEIRVLIEAGAQMLQIDEPALLRDPADLQLVASALAELHRHSGNAQLFLAVYFGNVGPLYENLLALPVDGICLDFLYSRGLDDVITAVGSTKPVALGLLDGRNTKLEDASELARRVERIAKNLRGSVYLTTSCGLEYLPRNRAQDKLRLLSEARNEVLGRTA